MFIRYQALIPHTPDELIYSGKRSPSELKAAMGGLRDSLRLLVHLSDGEVLTGPVRFSPLAEGWMVAGTQIASKTTPDKTVQAIHIAQEGTSGLALGTQ